MAKIYRILGKRGNTTIPYALRVFLGFRPNDLLSFRAESDEVIIRREKICDDCCTSEHRADAPTSSEALRSFLSSLPANVQKEALIYLSLGIAQSKPKKSEDKSMNQFPYLYPHSLSEAERLNEEELWQDNRDAEVSHTQLTEMFRHSDPAALMDEAEQAQLAELDDTVTVYRGVTTINSDNLLALSWTLDYETADWFARRFDEDGTVYKAQIDKEHIFALFNGRDESEVVLDPKYLKDITQAQEPTQGQELSM